MDNQDNSLAMACVELAKLIAAESKEVTVSARMENPRAYWLTLVAECRQALGGSCGSKP